MKDWILAPFSFIALILRAALDMVGVAIGMAFMSVVIMFTMAIATSFIWVPVVIVVGFIKLIS